MAGVEVHHVQRRSQSGDDSEKLAGAGRTGSLAGLSLNTLCRYLGVLAEEVRRQRRLLPPRVTGEVQAEVQATLDQSAKVRTVWDFKACPPR